MGGTGVYIKYKYLIDITRGTRTRHFMEWGVTPLHEVGGTPGSGGYSDTVPPTYQTRMATFSFPNVAENAPFCTE